MTASAARSVAHDAAASSAPGFAPCATPPGAEVKGLVHPDAPDRHRVRPPVGSHRDQPVVVRPDQPARPRPRAGSPPRCPGFRSPACGAATLWVSRHAARGASSASGEAFCASRGGPRPRSVEQGVLTDGPLTSRADAIETEPHPERREGPHRIAALHEHHLSALVVHRNVRAALAQALRRVEIERGRPVSPAWNLARSVRAIRSSSGPALCNASDCQPRRG